MVEQKFAFLLSECGFAIAADLAYESDLYLAEIATGEDCQIKFLLEKGYFELNIGPLTAPREWADGKGPDRWHPFVRLRAFEDRLQPEKKTRPTPISANSTLADTLEFYATYLRAYLPRLAAAFSREPPTGWWEAYETFLAERSKAAFTQ